MNLEQPRAAVPEGKVKVSSCGPKIPRTSQPEARLGPAVPGARTMKPYAPPPMMPSKSWQQSMATSIYVISTKIDYFHRSEVRAGGGRRALSRQLELRRLPYAGPSGSAPAEVGSAVGVRGASWTLIFGWLVKSFQC